jgi:uncharacterized membrane protein YGL010W
MMGGKSWDDWIEEYSHSHEHPINRLTHSVGIPMIALSILMVPFCFFIFGLWRATLALFVIGWMLQFVGHYFEGKPPEFFKDWRFLFVGLRWWLRKVIGIRSDAVN